MLSCWAGSVRCCVLHSVQSCILLPATGYRKVRVTCSNARGRWKCLLSLEILRGTNGSELSPFLMALSRGLAALCRCVGRLPCLLKRQEKQQCAFSMFPIPVFQLLCAQKGFNPSILASPLCCSQGPAPSPSACHGSGRAQSPRAE